MADQVLSRTLNQKFDTVFEEVTHQETLNLLNRNDLKLFCLDIETNQFNYDPLVEFLEDNLGMYVFSRAELDELVDAGKDRTVAQMCIRDRDIRVTDRASSFTNIVISIRTINMGEHGH